MKKIFTLIGMLAGIFSIYLMLLIADKESCLFDSTSYDYSLDKKIELTTLEQLAKKCDVTIQIQTLKSSFFGNFQCDIEILNSPNSIKYGIKKGLFPNQKINVIKGSSFKGRTTRHFVVQDDDYNNITILKDLIEKEGIETDIIQTETIHFGIEMLFSPLNLSFFVALFSLAFFATFIYYISRTKEIGVLKMNGWTNLSISWRVLSTLLIYTTLGFFAITTIFSIYILIADYTFLFEYIYMIISLWLSIVILYFIVALFATIYIKNINYVDAVKNKKNNRLIYILLMGFKIVFSIIMFIMATHMLENISYVTEGIKGAKKINSYNWYVLTEHISLSDDEVDELNSFIKQFDDSQIYNYCSSDRKLSKTDAAKYGKDVNSIESNMLIVSHNLLPILDVKCKETNLSQLNNKKSYLLIPENIWDKKDKIIDYEDLKNIKTIKIDSNQWILDYNIPGKYSYNSVILVDKLIKKASLGYADVFFTEDAAKKIEGKLKDMGYESSDISLESLKKDIDIHISTYQINLFESVLYTFILFITYLLLNITLVSIYYEFKKKKFAIYNLLGQTSSEDVFTFIIYNASIIIITSIIVNKKFIFLSIIEILIFYIVLRNKNFKNITTIIKGR